MHLRNGGFCQGLQAQQASTSYADSSAVTGQAYKNEWDG
jgi:hypothetical protein